MGEQVIEQLMETAMTKIKEMVDVQTIVGKPVETPDGQVIIPVSRVCLGFAAGGGDFNSKREQENQGFAGGNGAGISLNPVAFLVVGGGQVRLLTLQEGDALEKLVNVAPDLLEKLQGIMGKQRSGGHL